MKTLSASDWDEEFRAIFARKAPPPACPACHRSAFYGPRKAEDRIYEMCKFCGLYKALNQNLVQLIATVHGCLEWPQIVGAPYVWWVQPNEQNYECPYCGSKVAVSSVTVTRPVDASHHPWWTVPQEMTFEESRRFWVEHGQPRVYL